MLVNLFRRGGSQNEHEQSQEVSTISLRLVDLAYRNGNKKVEFDYASHRVCVNGICSDEMPDIVKLMPNYLRQIAGGYDFTIDMEMHVILQDKTLELLIEKRIKYGKVYSLSMSLFKRDRALFTVKIEKWDNNIRIDRELWDLDTYHLVINLPLIKHITLKAINDLIS